MNLAKFFNQTAVYWPPGIEDGYGGMTYGEPTEVRLRWAIKQEKFLSGSPGNSVEEILSSAVVLSETDFEINGRLFLGTLDDLSSDDDPNTNQAATIKGFNKIPTIKADQFLRKAWLV
jgi:hypothetical protein